MLPELTAGEWGLACVAGMLVGASKTGLPGVGMLVVPVMAHLFGGRLSVGALLPLLIVADMFAVTWYRRDCRWDLIGRLALWVGFGVAAGAGILAWFGGAAASDAMGPWIGGIVLAMLATHLALKGRNAEAWSRGRLWTAGAGVLAGITTTISNAAGPVMSLYMAGQGVDKRKFVGTLAWFFFAVNVSKVPILAALTFAQPERPLMTVQTLAFDLVMAPLVAVGAFGGRKVLEKIPQSAFEGLVLVLAAAASVTLLVG